MLGCFEAHFTVFRRMRSENRLPGQEDGVNGQLIYPRVGNNPGSHAV